MSTKLYVGGISWNTNDQLLSDAFAAYGTVVSARVVTDRETGRSRGFGFVEMGSAEEAQKAIGALNGTELDGRSINVSEARPQEEGARRTGGGGFGGGNRGGGYGGGSRGGQGGGNRY